VGSLGLGLGEDSEPKAASARSLQIEAQQKEAISAQLVECVERQDVGA